MFYNFIENEKQKLENKGYTKHEIDYTFSQFSHEQFIEQYRQIQRLQAQCNSLSNEINNKNKQISQMQQRIDDLNCQLENRTAENDSSNDSHIMRESQ